MSNPTSNFGWQMPTSTDLVTDLPADFEVFGQAVDTSLADLKGGTTGQILSKASGTDMDFTWVAPTTGDITGVSVTSPITGGGTSGDVTIGIASSAIVPSQTGNSGKYLTTDGTSSSWGTISAGGMTLISTTSMSGSASITLSSIPQTYKDIVVLLNQVTWNTSDSELRILVNNGYSASGTGRFRALSGNFQNDVIKLTLGNNTSRVDNQNHYCLIRNYASTTAFKPFEFSGSAVESAGSVGGSSGGGAARTTSAVTSLVIDTAHGTTFNAGTILLYGVN